MFLDLKLVLKLVLMLMLLLLLLLLLLLMLLRLCGVDGRRQFGVCSGEEGDARKLRQGSKGDEATDRNPPGAALLALVLPQFEAPFLI